MKKINKIINALIIVSFIALSICSFNGKVYAENQTGNANTASSNSSGNSSTSNTTGNTVENKTSTNTQTNTTSTSNASNTKTTTSTKSNNANLSNLGIKPNDFKGFKAQTTTYNVTVPNDVESVTIYATAQDSKASISGIGKKDLKEGTNKFDVIITAENGATKTYTINITKSENTENTENVQGQYTGDGLATLDIENVELSPKFDTIVYEYTGKYIGEAASLNINATTTDPYYEVEITGNENLVEGENIINIFEPETIAIGGSFANFKEVFLDKLKEKLSEDGKLFNKKMPNIVMAKLKNDAGIIGAVIEYKV